MSHARASQTPLPAIGIMIVAVSCFSLIDATAKLLIHEISVYQILWVRFLVFLGLMSLFIGPRHWPGLIAGPRLGLQIVRGAIPMVAAGLIFVALKTMELADVTALFFASPFFLTALSVPLLGERVGWHRWAAVAVGFAGVMIVARPGSGIFGWTALLPLIAAAFYGMFQITTRLLSATASPRSMLLFSGLVGAVATGLVAPFVWVWPTPMQWFLLVAGGVLNLFVHFLLIQAFARAPATVLSPFNYMQVFAAVIIGYLVFAEIPDTATFAGIAVIVAAGLYMVHRERRLAR